jgi:hypothetical protein
MTLAEIVADLDRIDDEMTIFVSAELPDTEAVVGFETDEGQAPQEAKGMHYLLEVFIAKEVIADWPGWHDGRCPSLHEKVTAILNYARNDA